MFFVCIFPWTERNQNQNHNVLIKIHAVIYIYIYIYISYVCSLCVTEMKGLQVVPEIHTSADSFEDIPLFTQPRITRSSAKLHQQPTMQDSNV
jgi:hypothetical protein